MPLSKPTDTLRDIPVTSKKQRIFMVRRYPGPENPLLRTNLLSTSTNSYTAFFLHAKIIAIESILSLFLLSVKDSGPEF